MRKGFIGGNWKMNGSKLTLLALVEAMKKAGIDEFSNIETVLFPAFPYLSEIAAALQHTQLKIGAQNLAPYVSGAFTGEVSASMLSDLCCSYVLVGHSERRHIFHEDLKTVATKMCLAVDAGLNPVLCVGETLSEREQGMTESVIAQQLNSVVEMRGAGVLQNAVIAYEPVWAIGTGRVASPDDVQRVHYFIRERLSVLGKELGESTRIIYGGSLKPENAEGIINMPDVDGGLIGGASLNAEEFLALCRTTAVKRW